MSVNKNKILGIDYGDFSIGLAIFDFETKFCYPYKTIFREKANILRKSLREIIAIIEKEKITEVVIGYPLNMDDTEGERIEKVKTFAKMLDTKLECMCDTNRRGSPCEPGTVGATHREPENRRGEHCEPVSIKFQDERLTTKEADEILKDRGIPKSRRKEYIDQVAAEIILNDYVNSKS